MVSYTDLNFNDDLYQLTPSYQLTPVYGICNIDKEQKLLI